MAQDLCVWYLVGFPFTSDPEAEACIVIADQGEYLHDDKMDAIQNRVYEMMSAMQDTLLLTSNTTSHCFFEGLEAGAAGSTAPGLDHAAHIIPVDTADSEY